MNLPWSNWTSRDVFPTPLSPTRIVCKDQVKRHQHTGARTSRHGGLPGAGHFGGGMPGLAAVNMAGSRGTSPAPVRCRAVSSVAAPWHNSTTQPRLAADCPHGLSAPWTDGLSRCALSFTVTFGPVACLGRNFHPSDHLCSK